MNISSLDELTTKPLIPTWLIGIFFCIGVCLVVGLLYAYGQQQFHRGEVACALPYLKRANADLAEANDFIIKLQKEARDAELAHVARLAEMDKTYQEKQSNEKAKTDAVIAKLRSGIVKLQYRTPAASSQQTSADSTSAAGPGPGSSDGAETSELPPTLAGDLYDLTARADEITEQLTACQQVIVEDRRVCGLDSPTE